MASVWVELKRRNVVRVAIAYAVVGWLTLQFADVLVPLLGLPEWVGKFVFLLLAIGFPLALIFAWAYELTPEGLKKEKEVDRSQSITSDTGRKLDYFVIAVMAVALAYFAIDKFLPQESPGSTEIVADEEAEPPETAPSIAVLPFANMSTDESSVFFSDGLADTVLHMLAQVRELRVAARTSSFQFRDQSMDVAKIGEQLNVGTILEGSVQKSGDKIRVTAQLIDVSSGYHLWSGTFDRNLDDVFAIQDEIANEVVAALKVSLLGEDVERLNVGQTDNVDAYTEYLHAIDDLNSQSIDTLISAVAHLQGAIRLDPNYAQAYSKLGHAYFSMRGYGAMRNTEAILAARNAATRALDLSPESSEALAVLGNAERLDGNMEAAGQLLKKAIEIAPNDSVALSYYGRYLSFDDRPGEAILTLQKLLRLDPLNETNFIALGATLSFNQRYAEAREVFESLERINPKNPSLAFNQGLLQFRQGNLAAAIAPTVESVELDPNDPEGAAELGRIYLALDMPDQATRSFDRAVEKDADHPVSRSAPLVLNLYLQQNSEENFQLARELLEDRIDSRRGSRYFALYVLVDGAGKTDRHHIALELLDNLYPHLFDDPPHDLDKDRNAVFFAGRALLQGGDIDRGSHLIDSYLRLNERFDEVYHVEWEIIASQLLIGDKKAALEKLDIFATTMYFHTMDRTVLQHDSVFDPIREEPAFIALMDEYRENAAEQRQLLQAMNKDTSSQ